MEGSVITRSFLFLRVFNYKCVYLSDLPKLVTYVWRSFTKALQFSLFLRFMVLQSKSQINICMKIISSTLNFLQNLITFPWLSGQESLEMPHVHASTWVYMCLQYLYMYLYMCAQNLC